MSRNSNNSIARAVASFRGGDLSSAERIAKRVVLSQPRDFHALHLLGLIKAMKGDPSEAVKLFKKALLVNDGVAELHSNMAKAQVELGCYDDALLSYDKVIALGGGRPEILLDKGSALTLLERHEEALAVYDAALALRPDYADAWSNRGTVLDHLRKHDEALESFDKANALAPNHANAWTNRGIALDNLKRFDEALACHDKALAINPSHAKAWCNKGVTLVNLGRCDEALGCYHKAIACQPNYADAHFNEAICRISSCDFALGWQKYEWRWKTPKFISLRPTFSIPQWNGLSTDRSLLVWGEQGVGDQIFFCSMLEALNTLQNNLIVATDERLHALLARSYPQFEFIPLNIPSLERCTTDAQIALGSIGQFILRDTRDFAQIKHGYLKSDSEKTNLLRKRIAEPGKIICGLSWASNKAKLGHEKSLDIKALAPVLGVENVVFVNLQYGDTDADLAYAKESLGIEINNFADVDKFNDLDALASLVDACDIVVTVSNVTAHLAGALAKKTFLMLPRAQGKLWYWHNGKGASLWYPTIQFFEQAKDGDWESVIDGVRDAVRGFRDKSASGSAR